jgi:hypothetical protein
VAAEKSSEYPYDSSPGYSQKLQGVALETGRQRVNIPVRFEHDEELTTGGATTTSSSSTTG